MALEKSMYQTISEDMVRFFANSNQLRSYENLIGEPVNKYRQSYKELEKLRNLYLDNFNGVKIAAKLKPINIAVIDTAIVIRVA